MLFSCQAKQHGIWFKTTWLNMAKQHGVSADTMHCAQEALLSLVLPRQEYWSGQPSPSRGDLLYPRIKLASPHWQEDFVPFSHLESPRIHTAQAPNEWVLIFGIVSSLLADFSRTDLL